MSLCTLVVHCIYTQLLGFFQVCCACSGWRLFGYGMCCGELLPGRGLVGLVDVIEVVLGVAGEFGEDRILGLGMRFSDM